MTRVGVFDDIVQRLLHEAVDLFLNCALEPGRRPALLVTHFHVSARLGSEVPKTLNQFAERRSHADGLQDRR